MTLSTIPHRNTTVMEPVELMPDLFCFRETCNVFVVRDGTQAIAIDYGSGRWRAALPGLGIGSLEHVFLTHHHVDQCAGLAARRPGHTSPFVVHAPMGEEPWLSPEGVRSRQRERRAATATWFPTSYALLPRGIRGLRYDMAGFGDLFWGTQRIRFIHTPGHGQHALSIVMTHHGKQIVFCGDAAHDGATLVQPYHLEWDHWTGTGALAAWEGVRRLADLHIDLLCPSHGPVVRDRPRRMLQRLEAKLLALYRAKGHICAGERDDYLPSQPLAGAACGRRLSPHLVQYSTNGYVLLSDTGEAMLIDPPAEPTLTKTVIRALGRPKVTAATATHYHGDHSQGLPHVRQAYGAEIWLHPWVDEALRRRGADAPLYAPDVHVRADRLWPVRGRWRWNSYNFRIAPFPGQTRWHATFMAQVDGRKVMFAGDSFQPPSRWNGTGGFCAINGCRFDAFARSARLVLQWSPDILATGHRTYYRFHASQFRKIIRWARQAEAAVKALCPSGDLDRDYYLHRN